MNSFVMPHCIQIRDSQKCAACLPVVAQVDAVRIQHGDDLEDHMISQDLSHGMLAHQEVNHTYIKHTRAHRNTHTEIDLKREPKTG